MGARAKMAKEPSQEAPKPILVPVWDPDTPDIIKDYFDLETAGDPPETYIVCRECDEVFPKDTMLMQVAKHGVSHVPGAQPPEARKSSR